MRMPVIENCFYRVSVKALVLNETKDKFLICQKITGVWELPGGGLDWGAETAAELTREIAEEMSIPVVKIAPRPAYFLTGQTLNSKTWIANVIYETVLEHLDFTPSNECQAVKFVDKNDLSEMNVFPIVQKLAVLFEPKNHL